MCMESLEKLNGAMKLAESKKVLVKNALHSLFVEWNNLDEHLNFSAQQLLQDCMTDIQLRYDRLNKVQQSVTDSNEIVNEIRRNLEDREAEVERKEEEFREMCETKSKVVESEEKDMSYYLRFVEGASKEFELKEKKIDEKKRLIEGVYEKIGLEKGEIERIRGLIEERFEVVKVKEKSIEDREVELDNVKKNVVEKERELESREKELVVIRDLNEKKSKEFERREECLAEKENKLDVVRKFTHDLCTEYNSQKEKLDLEKKVVDERAKELEVKQKELEVKEKYFKEWVEVIDIKEKEIDSNKVSCEERCRVLETREKELEDQLRGFELKEKQFKEGVKTYDLKKKEIDLARVSNEERCKKLISMEKNLHHLLTEFKLKEQQFEERIESFNEKEKEVDALRISCEERCKKVELEKKQEYEVKEKHLKEWVRTIDLKEKEVDSVCILNEERCKKLDSMEKNLHDLLIGFKLKEQHEDLVKKFEAKVKEVDSIRTACEERCRKLELEKKKLEDQIKEMKNKQFNNVDHSTVKQESCRDDGSYADIRFSITMGGKNLLLYLINHKRDLDSMTDEVFRAIGLSTDPAKLVLDALQDFYLKKEDKEFEEDVVCKSGILLLEQLRRVSPQIQSCVKKAALQLAKEWKNKMKSSGEVTVFLQLLASYGLGSAFEPEEFFNLFEVIGEQMHISELCQLLGYTDKISDLIQAILKKKQHVKAIRYICAFGLRDRYQPVSLLKDLLRNAEETTKSLCEDRNYPVDEKDKVINNIVASLRAAIACIYRYKLESEFSPNCIELLIQRLMLPKEDEKATLSTPNNDAPKQEAENCKSATIVPDPDEGCCTLLKANKPVGDINNALSIILSDMDGKSLQLYLNKNVEDHELLRKDVLNTLKLSRDPAKLVLDAIQGLHPPHLEMGDKHFTSHVIMRSCIILLEQLTKRSAEIKPQVKKDALKLAYDWKAKMRTPLQILGFLHLVSTYGLNSRFEVSELERHFESVSLLKHAPELCRFFRFLDKSPDQTTTSKICRWHQNDSCDLTMNTKANNGAKSIHSANNAKLVLDALQICYYSNLSGKRKVKPIVVKSFTILAEKLLKMSPEIQPRVTKEAAKFAVDWKSQLVENNCRNPIEIFGFFNFLALYKVGSSFDPNELLGFLDSIYVQREVPHLVRLIGLAHKIPDFIEYLIQKGDRLQAIRYIYKFELVGKLPPVPIIKDHLSCKKLFPELLLGEETSHDVKSKSKQLAALRAVVKCVKDYHLEVEYPLENLLARIEQLQEQVPKENANRYQRHKKLKKRQCAAGPNSGPETQWRVLKHPRIEPPVTFLNVPPPAIDPVRNFDVPPPAFHPMTNFVSWDAACMQEMTMPFVFNPHNTLPG